METDTTTPNNVETATVRRRKDTTRKTGRETMCNARVCMTPTMLKEPCKKDPSFRYYRRSTKNLKGMLGVVQSAFA